MGKKQGVIAILLVLLTACTQQPENKHTQAEKATVEFARHFSIEVANGYSILKIRQPDTGKTEAEYVLVKAVNKHLAPKGLPVIEVPVKRLTALSSTHLGMLDALQSLDVVSGTGSAAFIANPEILKGIRSGKISDFGDENALTPEALLKQQTTLVMYSGFGKEFPQQKKLEKLGIVAMANYDWREEHPLGKAEWIKVFGYLIDQPEAANRYFEQVKNSYQQLKKQLKNRKYQPKVLVGSLIGDVWYAPAGKSYMALLLRDAGADYLYARTPGTGSCELTLERVYKNQQRTNIWINAGATTLSDLKKQQPKYALFTAFRQGKVFCYTHNSNYFWEMAAVNPHWLLQDFAVICGTKPPDKLHFYQQLTPR